MNAKTVLTMAMAVCLCGLVAHAEIVVTTADGNGADTFVGNDSNKSPNNNYGGSNTLDIRWWDGVRAHIGYIRFDITEIGGIDPTGAYLKLYLTQAQNSRDWDIYGLNDNAVDDAWDEMSVTYNNIPGMLPTETPSNGTFNLDEEKTTFLGTMFVPGGAGVKTSNPETLDLASFIKQDTNNLVTFILVGSNNPTDGAQYYVLSKEGAASSTDPNQFPPSLVLPVDLNPFQATNPNPKMNEVVSEELAQLCWTAPEPNAPEGIITFDVYFGTNEPNLSALDYDLEYTLALGTTDTCVALPIAPEPLTRYYWVVDVHDTSYPEITRGRLWSFNTFNTPPSVEVSDDQYIWLGHLGDPATATATITATVTDDGQPFGTLSYLWELVSGPELTISPNDVKDLTQVFTEPGTYILRLTASDGIASNYDSVRIVVGANACEAAKLRPGYNANPMDFNADCVVDINDFVVFANQWLECTSLDCP
jgi:hypothetical protein